MKMNKRKQKLEIKAENLLSTMKDSLMDYDVAADWLSSSANSVLETSVGNFCDDDLLNLLDLPLNFDEEPLSQDNQEIFQDLCCTSTPKSSRPSVSKIFSDSGFEDSIPKKLKKDNGVSYRVLEDITGKLNSINNANFVNLSHISESSSCDTSGDNSFKRHVNILRKDIVLQTKNRSHHEHNSISKEQLLYYTGFKSYGTAIAVLKHIKMPKCQVSSFKMELMALMKLRLDLPWLDMSFRFSIPETTVKEAVKKSIDIMSHSLEDLLPWHAQKKNSRRTVVKMFYAYSLKSSDSSHIMIVLTDSKRPALYVSDDYETNILSISVVLNRCSAHLIPGDVLCVVDSDGISTFYTVNGQDVAYYLNNHTQNQLSFLQKCQKQMSDILSEFIIISKGNPDLKLNKLAKVACAIFNVNTLSEVHSSLLQKIFERSSQYLLK